MSDYARCVEMDKVTEYEKEHSTLPEWLKDAKDASREEGECWVEFCVRGWVVELAGVSHHGLEFAGNQECMPKDEGVQYGKNLST